MFMNMVTVYKREKLYKGANETVLFPKKNSRGGEL